MDEKLAVFHLEWCMALRTFDELDTFLTNMYLSHDLFALPPEEVELLRPLLNAWWQFTSKGPYIATPLEEIAASLGHRYALGCIAWAYGNYPAFAGVLEMIPKRLKYGTWEATYLHYLEKCRTSVLVEDYSKLADVIRWAYPTHPILMREHGYGN